MLQSGTVSEEPLIWEQKLIFKKNIMKNLVYLLMMLLGLALTSCEPMEDIHEEVDAAIGEPNVQSAVEIRLTEDDYTTDIEDGGLGLEHTSFNTIEDARALIPRFLSANYPAWGKGSLALVTYDLYSPLVVQEHTVTASGYEALGLSVEYFTDFDQIEEFLKYQFPDLSEGAFVELTYDFLSEEKTYQLDEEDYDVIGEELNDKYADPAANAAEFNTFEIRVDHDNYWSNDMIIEAIGIALDEEFGNIPGQVYNVTYETYSGSGNYSVEDISVVFDGNEYVAVGARTYQLSYSDYGYIETALGVYYPGPTANAAQYGSFDVTGGSNNWSEAMILEGLNAVLMDKFPAAQEGAEFEVTYKVFLGGDEGTELRSTTLVLENGKYIESDSEPVVYTVEETQAYALINNNWIVPFTLKAEDYTAMGQRFANFDDDEQAAFKITTFLEIEFPYSEEGDLIPVVYEIHVGGGNTETHYANFRFENGEFVLVPNVVQQSLQFGHNGSTWEPDNTIEYTLTKADFAVIGEELIDKYPDPADNAGFFGSFNRTKGNADYWSDEMLLEAVIIILNDIAPNPEEGQKYVIHFATFTGSLGMESISVIYQDGEWVLNE